VEHPTEARCGRGGKDRAAARPDPCRLWRSGHAGRFPRRFHGTRRRGCVVSRALVRTVRGGDRSRRARADQ